jgi:hypothetical protein
LTARIADAAMGAPREPRIVAPFTTIGTQRQTDRVFC